MSPPKSHGRFFLCVYLVVFASTAIPLNVLFLFVYVLNRAKRHNLAKTASNNAIRLTMCFAVVIVIFVFFSPFWLVYGSFVLSVFNSFFPSKGQEVCRDGLEKSQGKLSVVGVRAK